MADYYMGLMSGTSLDGADGVLVVFENAAARVIASASADFPPAFREELLALNTAGINELHRAALAANRSQASMPVWCMTCSPKQHIKGAPLELGVSR